MEYKEYAKRRLKNEERLAVMTMDMLSRSFAENIEKLLPRLNANGVTGIKRDLGMMAHICKRFVKGALEGCPPDIAAQIIRQSQDFVMGLERRSPVRRMEECVMTLEDEWQLIHIVLESRCSICMKVGEECTRCGVRKLLRKFVDEPEPGIMTECGYMGCDLGDSEKLNKQERL